jgi:hypothetical protein
MACRILFRLILLFSLTVAWNVHADETKLEALNMKNTVLRICQDQDTFAAIEHLVKQDDRLATVKTFHEVMHHYYWKEKDLSRAIAFGRAGLQHGLTAALPLQAQQPGLADELRSAGKALAYDLASFTWTGWDEPGITITAADLRIGLDAARTNLRLAVELKKEPLPLSRAHWMRGAQQLAAGKLADAAQSFQQAATLAKASGTESEHLLSLGFVALVNVLQSQGKTGRDELEAIKTKLKQLEDGEFFVGQLDTAFKVFSK